ncbi:MAG: hypothetical protein AAB483_01515 [Patescibacteria group bacterium]
MDTNSSNNKKDQCAVVVSSFDGNEDLWKPFFTLFFRYWPDCPFPVYLISNEKKYLDDRVTTISVGKDISWADTTKKALQQISEPYILWLLDDLFLEHPTDTDYVLKLFEDMKIRHAACYYLTPRAMPNERYVSLLAGLWDKKVFLDLLKSGENPWQMEIEGTERSRSFLMPFLAVDTPALHHPERTAIVRGKWTWEGMMLCRKERMPVDFKKRGIDYARKWRSLKDQFRKKIKRYLKM